MNTNDVSIQTLVEMNSLKRQDAIMRRAYQEITWDQLKDELDRLDAELENAHLNWAADNRLIMMPFDLTPEELLIFNPN